MINTQDGNLIEAENEDKMTPYLGFLIFTVSPHSILLLHYS